jgi:hypothetical protein
VPFDTRSGEPYDLCDILYRAEIPYIGVYYLFFGTSYCSYEEVEPHRCRMARNIAMRGLLLLCSLMVSLFFNVANAKVDESLPTSTIASTTASSTATNQPGAFGPASVTPGQSTSNVVKIAIGISIGGILGGALIGVGIWLAFRNSKRKDIRERTAHRRGGSDGSTSFRFALISGDGNGPEMKRSIDSAGSDASQPVYTMTSRTEQVEDSTGFSGLGIKNVRFTPSTANPGHVGGKALEWPQVLPTPSKPHVQVPKSTSARLSSANQYPVLDAERREVERRMSALGVERLGTSTPFKAPAEIPPAVLSTTKTMDKSLPPLPAGITPHEEYTDRINERPLSLPPLFQFRIEDHVNAEDLERQAMSPNPNSPWVKLKAFGDAVAKSTRDRWSKDSRIP